MSRRDTTEFDTAGWSATPSTMLGLISVLVLASASLQVVVAMPGGPGDTQAAQKPLRQFFDVWQANNTHFTLEGAYFAQAEAAATFITDKKPEVFVLAPAQFFAREKSEGLTAIAQMHVGGNLGERWALVVRKDAADGWAALKGKTISSSLLADPNTKKLVAVDGKSLDGFATLEYDRSPLGALKRVRDGTSAAVLIDEAQLLGLDKLPFGPELKVAAKTELIPRPIVAVGKTVPPPLREQLKTTVLATAKNEEAHRILMNFSVDGVAPSDDKLLAAARQRFK